MSFSTTNLAVVFTTLLAGIFLFLPRPRHNRMRTATITPLASIIGSGFLVLAPLLDWSIGVAAGPMMLGLCVAAYLFGGTIRFNISSHDRSKRTPTTVLAMESFSSAALAFAYVVSVAYYLNLFGSFGVALTAFDTPVHGRWPMCSKSSRWPHGRSRFITHCNVSWRRWLRGPPEAVSSPDASLR